MSGSLQKVLQCFSKHDMNMTHIESRPSKGSENRYHFNVDFDGKKDAMKPLLLALDEHCVSVLKLDVAVCNVYSCLEIIVSVWKVCF